MSIISMSFNRFLPLLTTIFLLIIVCIFLTFLFLSKKKNQSVQMNFLRSFADHFKPALGMEKNLDYFLLKTQELVDAPNYSFYIYNSVNQSFTLKTVRQLTSDTNIAPSYSGLLPYEKEKYDPPLSLSRDSVPSKTTLVKEGEVPLLVIPIKGGNGLIRIGPITKVPVRTIKNLNEISNLLEVPLKNLIEEEDQRRNHEVLETSVNTIKYIHQLFIHEVEYVKLLIQTSIKSAKPIACLVVEKNSLHYRSIFSFKLSKLLIQEMNSSREFFLKLQKVLGDKPFSIYQDTTSNNLQLQQLLKLKINGYFVCLQFNLLGKQYLVLYSFENESKKLVDARSQSIKMLLTQIRNYTQIKNRSHLDSIAYIDFLKNIADLNDQMSPFTIGTSKLMANYSMAIAKEMGLSEYQIQSIGLAAYLSNIGTVGLSDGLVNKEGLYSDKEYEQMKLHSEVGAAIIENILSMKDVALYVKHHHERMDGNGYPSRLLGEKIPIGARIIAVVQTFLAKINGRSYRDPLTFDDALKVINDSSGSQLDSKVVSAFHHWYETKRNSERGKNRALGNCWDLCCVPSAICSQCSAYGQTIKNCWEFDRNNCLSHGKICQTCFVYTEAMSRTGKGKKAVI